MISIVRLLSWGNWPQSPSWCDGHVLAHQWCASPACSCQLKHAMQTDSVCMARFNLSASTGKNSIWLRLNMDSEDRCFTISWPCNGSLEVLNVLWLIGTQCHSGMPQVRWPSSAVEKRLSLAVLPSGLGSSGLGSSSGVCGLWPTQIFFQKGTDETSSPRRLGKEPLSLVVHTPFQPS